MPVNSSFTILHKRQPVHSGKKKLSQGSRWSAGQPPDSIHVTQGTASGPAQ